MSIKKKILIGEISSYKAIVICRYLKIYYPNIELFTYDVKGITKIFCTKYSDYHIVANKNEILKDIKSIIINKKIDYFFPVINSSLFDFWKNKHLFRDSLNYLGLFSDYNILNNKIKLYDLAIKLEILVPERYDNVKDARFPFVIKPTDLSSAKGVLYIYNQNDSNKIKLNSKIIIQQFIKGVGVGYSFFCKDGNIITSYGHKRIAEYPVSGGSSTYREEYKDERMHTVASKIVSHLNYTGFAMFEFKLTNKNELYLIEVNPRIWGSINQGLVNGTNYFEGILGKSEIKKNIKTTYNTYLSPLVYLSFIKYLTRLNFKPLLIFLKNFRNNQPDVSLLSDPKGYLSMILKKIL